VTATGSVERRGGAISLSGLIVPTRERDERTVNALGLSLAAAPGVGWFDLRVTTEVSDDGGLDYLHCHELDLRADSSFGETSRQEADAWWVALRPSHQVEAGREVVAAAVWSDVVRHLAEADESGGRICQDEFTLTAAQKAKLREFVDAVGPVTDGSSATAPTEYTRAWGKIGVAECDEYLFKYRRCIEQKAPEAARAQMLAAMEAIAKTWIEAAQGPGRDGLATGCAAAMDAAKQAAASMGCEW
jgi:hypothetical protein